MLTIDDVLKIMVRGEKLPQQKLQPPTDDQIERLQRAEPEILNEILDAPDEVDPASLLTKRISDLVAEFGWYQATSILCMTFAHRYAPDIVPPLTEAPDGTVNLLRMFAMAAGAMAEEEGAWTIPLAMLADLGPEKAQLVTACAGFCAVVGHMSPAPAGEGRS
jgi:hypothetical protein